MANTSFSSLKRNSKTSFEKLNTELTKLSSGGHQEDERFWQPTADKVGTGSAVIRFLPAAGGEEIPFVRAYEHGFQGPGGWLFEMCPTTLGRECPVCQANSELWNTGSDANKKIVRDRKRKLYFVSNIYVVKDPANPDNDGKVFLYRYGKKIFDMLNSAMHPEFEDEQAINPFDLWEGANFRLKFRKVDGQRTYDKSEFDKPSALLDDDEALEAVWKSEYTLQDLIAPEKIKSAEDIKARLNKVLKTGQSTVPQNVEDADEQPQQESAKPARQKSAKQSPKKEEDSDLGFFQKLAQDDLDDEIPF